MDRGIPGPDPSYPTRFDRLRSNRYQASDFDSDSSQHTWSSGTSTSVSSRGYQFGQGPNPRPNSPSNRPANPIISASIPTPTPVGSGINISYIFAQVESVIGDPRHFPLIDAFLRGEEQFPGIKVSFTIERSGWISNVAEALADLPSPTATPDSSSSSVSSHSSHSVELPPLSLPVRFGESSGALNMILVVLMSTIAAPVASETQPSSYDGPNTRIETRGGSSGQPQARNREEVRNTSSFPTLKRHWMLVAGFSEFWQ